MASKTALAAQEASATASIYRHAQAIARELEITIPPPLGGRHRDEFHRRTATSQYMADVLYAIHKAVAPDSKDLEDPPPGVIGEYHAPPDAGLDSVDKATADAHLIAGQKKRDQTAAKIAELNDLTFGRERLTLSALDGEEDDALLKHPGIAHATIKDIHHARTHRDKLRGTLANT